MSTGVQQGIIMSTGIQQGIIMSTGVQQGIIMSTGVQQLQEGALLALDKHQTAERDTLLQLLARCRRDKEAPKRMQNMSDEVHTIFNIVVKFSMKMFMHWEGSLLFTFCCKSSFTEPVYVWQCYRLQYLSKTLM